jgi:hypothetical protein
MDPFSTPPHSGPGEGGWLGVLLRWIAENPSAWPLPFLAFLIWRQDQLLWALVQRLDALTDAIRALERLAH